MSEGVITALVALVGTMVGTFGGILTANKLTNYRIQQLEEKVEKHNSFGERIPVLEDHIRGMDARIKVLESFHRTKN